MKKILKYWRETLGWIIIFAFGYIFMFKADWVSYYQRDTFRIMLITITIISLAWLRVNKE